MQWIRRLMTLELAIFFLAGCTGNNDSLATVSGQVSFYGLPAEAEVIFEPRMSDGSGSGRPSTAFTDTDGNFTMFLTPDRKGVEPGRHHVSIKIYRWKNGVDFESLGAGTRAVKTAHLIRQVYRGNNHFDFLIGY